MKYRIELEIELPRARVIELFDDPANLPKWQPQLQSFEPLSGEPGEVGAKSRLKYRMRGREVEMIETIKKRNLPKEFSGTYEAPGIFNAVSNRFDAIADDRTRWRLTSDLRGRNLLMKLMILLIPGAFKRQSLDFMRQFKEFAETGEPVSGPDAV